MNKRGVALIVSYMVVAVLTILGSISVSRSVSEGNLVRRYVESEHAFWIAEAGLSEGYFAVINALTVPTGQVSFGGGTYEIVVTDTAIGKEIKVTGTYNSGQRIVKGYLLLIPYVFENTISGGGDITLSGLLAQVEVYDKTRISGTYNQNFGASGWFEDKQEGVDPMYTTITIPDKNGNEVDDEFDDFVLLGQEIVSSYPSEEVVYIETDDTVNIFPNDSLIGKRVVYVEGSTPGSGDVNIFFDATWEEGQDLTVISTGTITYVEPLQFQEDSRLSTASWDDYNEASIFRSEHESVMYAHDDANFIDILDWGSTTGNLIVNNDISLLEVLTYEKYYFSDRALNGDLPPGFQYLCGGMGNLSNKLSRWQEE